MKVEAVFTLERAQILAVPLEAINPVPALILPATVGFGRTVCLQAPCNQRMRSEEGTAGPPPTSASHGHQPRKTTQYAPPTGKSTTVMYK